MVWTPGQSLQSGKYIIDRILGLGGAGITYLARQQNARRDEEWVVIKTLKDELRLDPKWASYQTRLQQDFLNEALKLARCRHPHVVRVKELIREVTPEGVIDGMVMEYVRGISLAEHLGRGRLPEAEALQYIRQIGEALTVVHSMELLHRDVKPQNIMLRTGTSEAVLIDFGLAREFMPDLTQTHTESRTEGFAPLEQYDRRAKRGAYTDVYALAATLYCLLTGIVPRPAPNRSAGVTLEPPKQYNPAISDRVNKAILKGLELKAGDRPQSVQEWLSLLEEPIARSVAPVKNLPVQSESPNLTAQRSSSTEQNRTPIAQSTEPLQNVSRQSINSSPRRRLDTAQNRTPAARKRSRAIPWIRLAYVLAGNAIIGAFLTMQLPTALSWATAAAVAGTVVGTVAAAVVSVILDDTAGVEFLVGGTFGMMTGGVAGAVIGAVGAGGVNSVGDVLGAGDLAFLGGGVGAMAGLHVGMLVGMVTTWGNWLKIRDKWMESFSRSHTFLILAGTSLAGLGLGWLIGTIW